MASHLVVIDASARRHTIKTIPTKHLSDVLQEACAKSGLDPNQYGLKYNNKNLDLSLSIRLSGLTSGAKLNLIQSSRSPSVVSVALQLPTSSNSSGSSARLIDKFPSTTPLWQILRRFESGAAGGSSTASHNYNFTQRATPLMANGSSTASGAGSLCYEMPIINIFGRELATFSDLQKTLAQLGLNSGSALLRLNFRNTEKPLEEAMLEISRFFKDIEDPVPAPGEAAPAKMEGAETIADSASDGIQGTAAEPSVPKESYQTAITFNSEKPAAAPFSEDTGQPSATPQLSTAPLASSLTILKPPTNPTSTPIASSTNHFNPSDYDPSVQHAQQHQSLLASSARNRKLPSDAEIEASQRAAADRLASVKSVTVRLRFPDQTMVQHNYGREETVRDLYRLCEEVMERPNGEVFQLRVAGAGAGQVTLKGEDTRSLITELQWSGRVLVTVVWGDGVGHDVRRGPCLKEAYRKRAEELRVDVNPGGTVEDENTTGRTPGKAGEGSSKGKGKGGGGGDAEAKMKKFLGLGKLSKK